MSGQENPFVGPEKPAVSEPLDFTLRPLRISKRPDLRTQKSAAKPQAVDDFVCRPIRLGLASSPSQKRLSDPALKRRLSSSTELSQKLAADSLPASHTRSTSIQIKNLPIVQTRKRHGPDSAVDDTIFALCLVDFHHVRGPEIQWWRSNYHEKLDADDALFKNLPFQALPDGSHLFEETFSNFNLVYDFDDGRSLDDLRDIENFKGNPNHLETLFGCSCVRQIKTADLSLDELERNKDITRSIVQKAVVVISRRQPVFTKIKEKLSIITHSFFQQSSIANFDILESLFENLNDSFKASEPAEQKTKDREEEELREQKYEEQEEFFVNLNLRELLSLFKDDFLVILKALLLEKKILIYSNNNLELLTQFQNNLIALIPNLINHLELSGCPLSDYSEHFSPLEKPSSLKTNDRMSMLRFFGLPLQIFNTKGSFWNPYLPLQQMDELSADTVMAGCSNLIISNQLANFKIDLLVNLDTWSITWPMGKPDYFRLTTLDKKLVSTILATKSTQESYTGSDDYIRYQFEDYIRSLLSTTRFYQYVERFKCPPPGFDTVANKHLGNLKDFNEDFVNAWFSTKNYQIWNLMCDEFIFNFLTPSHSALEMEGVAQYNIGGFLSAFKKGSQPSINIADKANQLFSHAQKPRKFLENSSEADPDAATQELPPKEVAKPGWGWSFKK